MTQNTGAEAEARVAAERWLALVDAGDYAAAWEQAAALLKSQVDQAALGASLGNVRSALGAATARSVTSTTHATSLPGAPDGEYVVVQTSATFEHKKDAVETVTPMKEPDGVWRVSGYFVR